jgi:serine/threonine protein phosphatase PrpC
MEKDGTENAVIMSTELLMSLRLDIAYHSFQGPRERNEDSVGYAYDSDPAGLHGVVAAVADGVGSTPRGWMAAQTVVRAVTEDYFSTPATWEPSVAMDRVLRSHNSWIHSQNQRGPEFEMQTTLTALVVRGRKMTMTHLGDSRCYLLRKGGIQLLSEDHARGIGGGQSILTRSVGADAHVKADYRYELLENDDVLLLMTDGVWGRLRDKEILQLMTQCTSAEEMAKKLCATAEHKQAQDNGTVLALRVLGLDEDAFSALAERMKELPLPQQLKPSLELDGLKVLEKIADNGSNQVWRVERLRDKTVLALKTLTATADDLNARRGMIREAWLASSLDTDSSVQGVPGEQRASNFYVLYEWVSGETMAQMIQTTDKMEVKEWLRLARGLVRAVSALHRRGVIHRDIKPENLMLRENGKLCILDLGVALTSSAELNVGLERLAGTPSFINPEQWEEQEANEGSDLFAVGVTLFQLLTKQLPYGEIEPYQVARYQRGALDLSRLRPDVPMWIGHWLEHALAPQAAQRFQTTEEMLLWLDSGERNGTVPNEGQQIPQQYQNKIATLTLLLVLSILFNLVLVLALFFLPK